jgi:hypothetical protein
MREDIEFVLQETRIGDGGCCTPDINYYINISMSEYSKWHIGTYKTNVLIVAFLFSSRSSSLHQYRAP